jgi:hypothetical protein
MRIEVSEVIGKVHFGVQKRASFLSFIEEPYTRFAVTSEVGGDYKLTDIPRVSNLIIAKLKKYIKNKMCYPKAYKTRLLWPKKWWPEGEDEYKESASSSAIATTGDRDGAVDGPVDKDKSGNVDVFANIGEGVSSNKTNSAALAVGEESSDGAGATEPTEPPEKQRGLLASSGVAAMRDNLSKWLIKPLLHGKGSVSASVVHWKKGGGCPGAATSGVGPDLGDESEDDSSDHDSSAMLLALAPFRTDLLNTESGWDRHLNRAFFRSVSERVGSSDERGRLELAVLPPVLAALETSKARCGLGKSPSSRSQSCGATCEALPIDVCTQSRSLDPADTLPFSVQSFFNVLQNSVVAKEAKDTFRSRSYSITDLRPQSLAVSAYYYFSTGGGEHTHNLLHRRDSSASWAARDGGGGLVSQSAAGYRKTLSLSSALSHRLASEGGGVLYRRRNGPPRAPRRGPDGSGGGQLTAISSTRASRAMRFQTDGFILNTTPRKVDSTDATDHLSHPPVGSAAAGGDVSKMKSSNFFGFSRQLEKAKDALKSGLRRPDTRRSQYDAVDTIGSPDNDRHSHLESSGGGVNTHTDSLVSKGGAALQDDSGPEHDAGIKIVLPAPSASVGGGEGAFSAVTAAPMPASLTTASTWQSPPKGAMDLEKEAESLAWQARAQAITEASANGEYPSMQGFLLMKQNLPACKKWVVLRHGNMGVFNNPADNSKYGAPLTCVSLRGAICRPSGKSPLCFEIGIPMEDSASAPAAADKDGKKGTASASVASATASPVSLSVSFYWMPFWADSEVQCRAWVMAAQQSSHQLHADQSNKQKKECASKI